MKKRLEEEEDDEKKPSWLKKTLAGFFRLDTDRVSWLDILGAALGATGNFDVFLKRLFQVFFVVLLITAVVFFFWGGDVRYHFICWQAHRVCN